jgi:endonuclease YncB( thermonuclease family)
LRIAFDLARLLFVCGLLLGIGGRLAHAEPASTVYLNGHAAPVFFNDGDSFRVLDGELAGTKARLAGYNTLETHGPVHQWGDWTSKELYAIAKMATLNARRGTWHCESDLSRDGYGRMLWLCLDLAKDQILHGFAHVMAVGKDVGHPVLIEAQRQAMRARRGIWAKGIPTLLMTSNHSIAESTGEAMGENYNRLVSAVDGHSEKMLHDNRYGECENVCAVVDAPTRDGSMRVLARLRTAEATASIVKGIADSYLLSIINEFAHLKKMPRSLADGQRDVIERHLSAWLNDGTFGPLKKSSASCMLYVSFALRYSNTNKPGCLKW